MDEFPNKVHALCRDLLEDLTEELNELKQSNTTLLRRVETVERSSRDARATEAELERVREELDEQKHRSRELRDSIAKLTAEQQTVTVAVDEVLLQHNALVSKITGLPRLIKDEPATDGNETPSVYHSVDTTSTRGQLNDRSFHRERSIPSSVTLAVDDPLSSNVQTPATSRPAFAQPATATASLAGSISSSDLLRRSDEAIGLRAKRKRPSSPAFQTPARGSKASSVTLTPQLPSARSEKRKKVKGCEGTSSSTTKAAATAEADERSPRARVGTEEEMSDNIVVAHRPHHATPGAIIRRESLPSVSTCVGHAEELLSSVDDIRPALHISDMVAIAKDKVDQTTAFLANRGERTPFLVEEAAVAAGDSNVAMSDCASDTLVTTVSSTVKSADGIENAHTPDNEQGSNGAQGLAIQGSDDTSDADEAQRRSSAYAQLLSRFQVRPGSAQASVVSPEPEQSTTEEDIAFGRRNGRLRQAPPRSRRADVMEETLQAWGVNRGRTNQ